MNDLSRMLHPVFVKGKLRLVLDMWDMVEVGT